MFSAAAAGIKAFEIDRGLPLPVEDIAKADTQSRHPKQTPKADKITLVGSKRRGDDASDHAELRASTSIWQSFNRRRPAAIDDCPAGRPTPATDARH